MNDILELLLLEDYKELDKRLQELANQEENKTNEFNGEVLWILMN